MTVAIRPTFTSFCSDTSGCLGLYTSMVYSIADELNREARELIRAARIPQTTTPLNPAGEFGDQQREGDVGIGQDRGELVTEFRVERAGGGSARQREGNHAGDEEQEHREELEIGSENGAASGLLLVPAGEDPLDNELVRAPVPETDDRRADQSAEPRVLRVTERSHQVGHGPLGTFIIRRYIAKVQHVLPAAELLESEDEDHDGTDEQDGGLQHRGVEHTFHTTEDGVDSGDDNQADGGNPEEVDSPKFLDAENLLEYKTAGINSNGHLGQHIRDQRDNREYGTALCVVATLQELRHGINHASCVERNEYPTENKDHPSLNLPVGHSHTRGSTCSGKTNQVFRSDV